MRAPYPQVSPRNGTFPDQCACYARERHEGFHRSAIASWFSATEWFNDTPGPKYLALQDEVKKAQKELEATRWHQKRIQERLV